ncbi:MAG: efflux RND transporter periplasmic adaptor subunit [Gammaproteobacteria bacterium]|nr:efflux RND transporter periplasmic adaptor subunit [Gammaproteobacteria bacterium]
MPPPAPVVRCLVLICCLLPPVGVIAEGRVVRITAATVARQAVEETEWAVGVIESRAAPPVAAEVAGRVVRVAVDEGSTVEKGATLAELDSKQYRFSDTAEQAEVARLSALVKNKQSEYERARRLQAERLISQEQVETIATDLEALRAQLDGARARAGDSSRRLGEARIVAPFRGEVARRYVDVGAYVQAGTAVFDMVDIENLRVRLPFPEYRAPRLRPGLPVRLTSSAATGPPVTAKITEIQPGVNRNNRALTVIVDFTNPGDWRPGASVRADVVLETRPAALMVPQIAVVRRPAGDVLYVIYGDTVREQPVRRGQRSGKLVEITEGLKGGEKIAVDGAGFLTNGAKVAIAGR